MIEAYAFLAVFAVQILLVAYLHMVCFVKLFRMGISEIPDEQFARSPSVDRYRATAHFATIYRAMHAVITVLVVAWLLHYMERTDWIETTVLMLSPAAYFLLTFLPLVLLFLWSLLSAKPSNKVLISLRTERKIKAVLHRREIFDFVSPFIVWFIAALYFLSIALAIFLEPKPLNALIDFGGLTFAYAISAFFVYWSLYFKKRDPHATPAAHVHAIGREVRANVYWSITTVVFFWFVLIGRLYRFGTLHIDRWFPFGVSVLVVCVAIESIRAISELYRKPDVDALNESPAQ